MRYARQSKILEIIKSEEIYTQEELALKLTEAGFVVTQATISRDIKDLGIIKVTGKSGKSCYADKPKLTDRALNQFGKILSDTVISVKSTNNLIIIKTLNGCASAAAEVIDNVPYEEILGSIAGDNTVLLVVDKASEVDRIKEMIEEVIVSKNVK